MIKKNLLDLPLWAVLGQNIYTIQGQLLLAKGTVLQPMMLEKLMAKGIIEVYVENLEPDLPTASTETRESKLETAFLIGQIIVSDIIDRVRCGRSINYNDLNEAVNIFYLEVINARSIFHQLMALRTKDEYTLQHSIAVGAFGVKICQLLNLPEKVTKQVGAAGVMHDIGKVRTPDSILNKPGALNKLEWEQIMKHPQYGYEILRSSGDVEHEILLAVLQHHERLDGSGYPLGLPSNNIHLFSRILAVSDSFDAMTSERAYRRPFSIFKASEELMTEAYNGKLDAEIVILFVNYILDISPGQRVLLNTGEIAEIILPNKAEPNRPLVRVGGKFVNLEKNRDVWIEDFYKGGPE